jgi:hypothetical protein
MVLLISHYAFKSKHVIIHNEAEDFVGKHKRSNVTCVINSLRVEYEELSRYENADSS